jgi:hypothetical protein
MSPFTPSASSTLTPEAVSLPTDLANFDTEIGERLSTIFGALSSSASHSLRCEGFDFVVGLQILHRRDLPLHLMHLRFEVAQHLKELPGFRPWKKGHRNQDSYAIRRNCQPLVIVQAICLFDE